MNEYNVDFRFDDGILYVNLSGKFPKELLKEEMNLFKPLMDACSTYKCNKALIDATALEVDFQTMDLFRAGADAATLIHLGMRMALLAREDMLNPFFDNVVHNRGGLVGVFTDMNTAHDWLMR